MLSNKIEYFDDLLVGIMPPRLSMEPATLTAKDDKKKCLTEQSIISIQLWRQQLVALYYNIR